MKSIKFTIKAITAAAVLATAGMQTASAQSLNDVISALRNDASQLNSENQRRLSEFQKERDAQASQLASARSRVAALEARGAELAAQFEANEDRLGELQGELQEKAGDFSELLGQYRAAGEQISPVLRRSIISTESPGRAEAISAVSQARTLPERQELDLLWKAMLTEMIGQAEVKEYQTVVANKNNNEPVGVTRVGPFVAFTSRDREFLEMKGGKLLPFAAQPTGKIAAGANALVGAGEGQLVAAPFDPSQGDLLGIMADRPTLMDRIQQGGLPGYVVLSLLAIGLIIGFAKMIALFLTNSAVQRTAKTKQAGSSNPLARIFSAYEDARNDDVEALELRLDEAILRETPKLERGVNLVKVLAAVSPLLGLLGTVVGMIRTFTQITLVGTGDPKTMAGGISQALVTTVEGLVAAIPLILVHAIISAQAKGVQQVLEEQSAGMVAERAEQGGARV